MRLLLTTLLAALATQQPGRAQCSPQCSCSSPEGTWSPLYRVLTAPSPSDNDIVPRAPPRCSCGCSPRRLPPRPAVTQPHAVPALSGMVVDSPVFQQMGPATVIETPPPVYVSTPDVQTCPSHIMTIPRKQDNSGAFSIFESSSNAASICDEVPPTITYSTAPNSKPAMIFSTTSDESATTFSPTPQQPPCPPPPSNSVIPVAPSSYRPPTPPPRPVYYAQPAPLIATCPATLFYPAAPTPTYAQPSVLYQASPPASQIYNPTVYSTSNSPSVTYSSMPPQSPQCNFHQGTSSPSQSYSSGTSQNSPSNTMLFSNDFQHNTFPQVTSSPSQSFSSGTCQNSPSNTLSFHSDFQQNTFPQSTASSSQSFSSGSFQNAPSNTVTFNNDLQHSSSGDSFPAPQATGSPTSSDSPLTYTLLTSPTSDVVMDNRDCSVPVPPALV